METAESDSESAMALEEACGSGLVRTFLVFLDVPVHFEFRADMPLIPEGTEIEFRMALRNPKDPKRVRTIDGPYKVLRRKCIYSTQKSSIMGFSQYLELSPVEDHRSSPEPSGKTRRSTRDV